MRTITLITCVASVGLAGCVSSGTKVTAADMASFTPGVTTEAQVIARLGEPNSASVAPDGSRTDMYIYTEASANAASFIPVADLLAGGAKTKTTNAMFMFDPRGVLKSTSSGHGQSNVNTGLLNQ